MSSENNICSVCQEEEYSYFRRITETAKLKAEKGGYYNLKISTETLITTNEEASSVETLKMKVHDPTNIDVDLVSWALQLEYMSKLGINQKSSWFCMADSSKFTEEETINFLTLHTYDPDFQIIHPENKKFKFIKII
ncbi:1137_t:CDS:2 [Entrophospora sp. SA101]|nr:1137_t:CDS:2 [Entrophospora sp. SA101]